MALFLSVTFFSLEGKSMKYNNNNCEERTSNKAHGNYEIFTYANAQKKRVITLHFNSFLNRHTMTYGRLNNIIKEVKS